MCGGGSLLSLDKVRQSIPYCPAYPWSGDRFWQQQGEGQFFTQWQAVPHLKEVVLRRRLGVLPGAGMCLYKEKPIFN